MFQQDINATYVFPTKRLDPAARELSKASLKAKVMNCFILLINDALKLSLKAASNLFGSQQSGLTQSPGESELSILYFYSI
jgi:hypothetical protein